MNNQDYQLPDMASSFPHNVSEGTNEGPMTFHSNSEDNLNFTQHTFSVTDGFYENVNSQKASSDILNMPLTNSLEQNVAYGGNVRSNFNNSNEISQPYFSEFPNQSSLPVPYPGNFQSPEEQFVCNLSQPQVFSDQEPLARFSSPSNVYSNAQCTNNPQATNNSLVDFPTTSDYMNSDPKPMYSSMDVTGSSSNMFATSNGSTEGNVSAFPFGNGNGENYISTLSGNESVPYKTSEEPSLQSENDCLPHSNSEEYPQQDSHDVPHTSSEEFPSQQKNHDVPHTSSEEFPSQLDNNDVPHTSSEEFPSQRDNNDVPHTSSEEFPSQRDNNDVPHTSSEEFPSQQDNHDVPHTSSEEFSSQLDNEPHSNSDEFSCQLTNNVPHSSNEVDASGECDKGKENEKDPIETGDLCEIDNPTEGSTSLVTDVDQSVECGSTMETLDDLSYSLEKGIEASLEESLTETNVDQTEANAQRPLSPMITALDGEFLVEPKKEAPEENVRLTRTRTGTVRNKTHRYADEVYLEDAFYDDSSQDKVLYGEWKYEDGAELAPSQVDDSVTVKEDVLKVSPKELASYYSKFIDGVDAVLKQHLHCTACGEHIGASPNFIHIGNRHKVLRVLICNKCRNFYGVGKFSKDSDGSELFCRWCGQGGQVICCSSCPNVFCQLCIKRNMGHDYFCTITASNVWDCFLCNYELLWPLRATCWALLTYTMRRKKEALENKDSKKIHELQYDRSTCCSKQMKKRKPPSRPKTSRPSSSASNDGLNGLQFGHFLYDSQTSANTAGAAATADDEEYIDPSQFVQSVLEEPLRLQPKILPKSTTFRKSVQTHARPTLRPVPPPPQAVFCMQTNTQGAPRLAPVPRLVLRQGSMMRPGLLPINNQPNSMQGLVRVKNPAALRNVASIRPANTVVRTELTTGLESPSIMRNAIRNPANVLNQIDGVRSMEQIQALDQVPWYRDGIDNVRAVNFALTKRIRELEARFYSLKNKQDVEKVMLLGRKLERLSEKTEKRFNQMNARLKNACRAWCVEKMKTSNNSVDPFRTGVEDVASDWDDEAELSKPLEKVLIPVNSVALQAAPIRPTHTRVISRTTPPPLAVLPANLPANRPVAGPSRVQTTMAVQRPVAAVSYARAPGPKSSMGRLMPIDDLTRRAATQSITQAVGAFINKKNGANSVSISLTPAPKRQRVESGSSDSSDVMVCHTIPELIKIHKVKPCTVRLEKCDDFIVSFLERQAQARSQNTISLGNIYGEYVNPEVLMSDPVSSSSEFSEHFLSPLVEVNSTPEKQPDTTNSKTMNSAECPTVEDDDDDDIEIINEVSPVITGT